MEHKSSDYIEGERRDYSLYVLQQRAIPYASDGLKSSARRVLWTARNGSKFKSATLAGATMPIHPHQSPEGTVNTLAAPYGNNIPLLDGDGAFGTLLNPGAYAAARYTSVKVSDFTKDVVFRDIEIIPMQDNYDGTLQEPQHFLPLIPVALLNPQDGIAVGFASKILPRDLNSIINSQLDHLEGKFSLRENLPHFLPTDQQASDWFEENGVYKYVFEGSYEKVGATTVRITNLPYGKTHEKYIAHLIKLIDKEVILDYTDNSRDSYNIEVKFKRGVLSSGQIDIPEVLGLISNVGENLNVINFDGESVWSTTYEDLIKAFCDWRLQWYVPRYERLKRLLEDDIQKYLDILLAIKKNVGGLASKIKSRGELKEYLQKIGVVNIDYIADLSVYRFTEEERQKVEKKLSEAQETLGEYKRILKDKRLRKNIYISELQEIQRKYT